MSTPPAARAPLALAAAALALLALAPPALAQEVTRLEDGVTPAARAVAWSQASFADGAAPTVLITRDDDFADALGSGAVQGLLEAPLLLTNSDLLSPETAAEITRLGAEEAIVLGGDVAVSEGVVVALEVLGLQVERIGGETRVDTAVGIVDRFFPSATEVALARAFGEEDPTQAFADSLTLSPFSAASDIPVLFTETDALSEATADALSRLPVETVTVVGGEAAISAAVESAAAAAIDDGDAETAEAVRRAADSNRFGTAVQLNELLGYATGADAPRIILTQGQTGDAWTSGFPAGVQAGNGAATVLSNGDDLPPETLAYIQGAGVPLICGPGVTATACDAATAAIGG